MARDVECLAHKGRFNFKALTDKAREAMGQDMMMGDTWKLAADVFWYGVPPSRFDAIIAKLHAMGLVTDAPKASVFDIS